MAMILRRQLSPWVVCTLAPHIQPVWNRNAKAKAYINTISDMIQADDIGRAFNQAQVVHQEVFRIFCFCRIPNDGSKMFIVLSAELEWYHFNYVHVSRNKSFELHCTL